MADEPNPLTFDLHEVLAGRDYPELEVPVYLNEQAMFTISQTNDELTRLSGLGKTDEYNSLEANFKELLKSLDDQKYVFHLHGIPRKAKLDIINLAFSEFPEVKNAFGQVEQNTDRDEKYSNLNWQAYVGKIVAPSGASIVAPTEDQVADFRLNAPQPCIDAVEVAIASLNIGSKSGFDIAVRNPDFLSEPSVGA